MSETEETEIKLDFGAGNVAALPSRCLRVAKDPTDCDLCAQACPASAITLKDLVFAVKDEEAANEETTDNGQKTSTVTGHNTETSESGAADGAEDSANSETAKATPQTVKPRESAKAALEKKLGVVINEHCIHCGLCTTVCPLEALSTTKHHPKAFEKQLTERVAAADGIALSCARALFGVNPRLAARAISLPCLAALSSEAWFLAAAQAKEATLDFLDEEDRNADELEEDKKLRVFLPPFICDDCPVNICGDAVETYLTTISEAESWGADNIELVTQPEELAPAHSEKLMTTLNDVSSGDKRELVEQLTDGFRRSWQNAGKDLTREKKKAELLAQRRKKTKKPQPASLNAPRPFGKKSQKRRMLRSALELEESLAGTVELLCANTAFELCEGCGACVDACPVNARRKVSSNSVLYFGKLPEEKRPQETMAGITDELCCLGCSACVQVCPTGACKLGILNGEAFLKLRLS